MLVYKWTTPARTTRDDYQYDVGVEAAVSGSGPLCSSGWLHAYQTTLLAVLMRPAHLTDTYRILWECSAGGRTRVTADKLGCERLTLLRPIAPPIVTTAQRVRFGILAARAVCQDAEWRAWADAWLSGADRTADAAEDAARAAEALAAAEAAEAAVWATSAAVHAADAADADAAEAAARAAAWAREAAWAAAWEATGATNTTLDLAALAEQASREEQ